MRIEEIQVKELFGLFNHTIRLKEDRITVIHGSNGFGKTTILKMLYGLFNKRYFGLISVPFREFRVNFDDGNSICVCKLFQSNEVNHTNDTDISNLQITFLEANIKKWSLSLGLPNNSIELGTSLNFIDRMIPELDRVGLDSWKNTNTGEVFSFQDVFGLYIDELWPGAIRFRKELKELEELRKSLDVHFIETQRLQKLSTEEETLRSVSQDYSFDLVKQIRASLSSYGEESQKLDRTFPVRLVKTAEHHTFSIDELEKKLEDLEKKRQELIEIGLLSEDEGNQDNFQITRNQIKGYAKEVLSVYVQDVEKKLSVFDDIARKINLFTRIICDHFSYKELTVNKEKGFVFTVTAGTAKGKTLPPSNLSSGEQHELVLVYNLLFKVKAGSLILIDEPEISLHVAWQMQFLDNMKEISKLADLDILIATHSPEIINDNWDLTVGLKGPLSD